MSGTVQPARRFHARRAGRSAMAAALAAALWAGCAASAQAAAPAATTASEAPAATQPERPPEPPPAITYVCDNGLRIVARFPDSTLAMLMIGDDRYELKAGIAASGVRYEGGKVQFWTHQGKARFTREGAETECAPTEEPASTPKAAPDAQQPAAPASPPAK